MLEIYEIIEPAAQGLTSPFLCQASDNKSYYIKGRAATVSGLIKEYLAANLAQTFGLPIPAFQIAYLDESLVKAYGQDAPSYLGSGYVFASERVESVTEFKYELLMQVDPSLQRSILLFDLWIQNSDRTLTENGGNPNLLWQSGESKLHIIDHNLAFEDDFDPNIFWKTHVFGSSNFQFDLLEKQTIELKLQESLNCWATCWDRIPSEWKDVNQETLSFKPDTTLERLDAEAQGNIWRKLL